jgi:hypothetical protein
LNYNQFFFLINLFVFLVFAGKAINVSLSDEEKDTIWKMETESIVAGEHGLVVAGGWGRWLGCLVWGFIGDGDG